MKLSARHEINATQQAVFDALCDVQRYERRARARGVEVHRLDDQTGPLDTARWQIVFSYRGRTRRMQAQITDMIAPDILAMKGHVDGLDLILELQVLALTPQRSRVIATLDLRPTTLSARLLVQSLKLAKGALTNRLKKRLATFASDLEHGRLS